MDETLQSSPSTDLVLGAESGMPLATVTERRKSSFAPRATRGPVLRWSNVCMDLLESARSKRPNTGDENDIKTRTVSKKILDNVWGEARPGETTAIMGASGAGKTSLFSILSGHRVHNPLITVSGDVFLGSVRVDASNQDVIRRCIAFVGQEDVLHQQSTPREAIRFSARLRMGNDFSQAEIDELVESYIGELGLTKCADGLIGGELLKGISGGEKRRTSLGVALVTNPSTIFLDEPTSGLDSVAARTVLQLLDKVAKAGNTVLFTVHQPSSRVFSAFDNVILINSGRLMHMSSTSHVPIDFSDRGFPIPANTNPADWILEVSEENSVQTLEDKGFFPTDTRLAVDISQTKELVPYQRAKPALSTQIQVLLGRERLSFLRFPITFLFTLSVTVFLCVLSGILFLGVGAKPVTNDGVVSGILGSVVNTMLLTMMLNAGIINASVIYEKQLFLREFATDHYAVISFMATKFIVESLETLLITLVASAIIHLMAQLNLNFGVFFGANFLLTLSGNAIATALGAMIRDPKVSAALLTVAVLPQVFFSGLLVTTTLMPGWISWAQYLCSLRYTSGLVLLYEFAECGSADEDAYCEGFLTTYGLSQSQRSLFWGMSVAWWLVWQVLAFVFMRRSGLSFE